jgi:hypothetical protein
MSNANCAAWGAEVRSNHPADYAASQLIRPTLIIGELAGVLPIKKTKGSEAKT